MDAIITIKEAAILLNYKDVRSVLRWCEKKGVEVFSEEGSHKKYIIRLQFEYARLNKFIESLKLKFKDNWIDVFKKYTSMNVTDVIEIEEMEKVIPAKNVLSYKPKGKHEMNFLSKLQKITPEL